MNYLLNFLPLPHCLFFNIISENKVSFFLFLLYPLVSLFHSLLSLSLSLQTIQVSPYHLKEKDCSSLSLVGTTVSVFLPRKAVYIHCSHLLASHSPLLFCFFLILF